MGYGNNEIHNHDTGTGRPNPGIGGQGTPELFPAGPGAPGSGPGTAGTGKPRLWGRKEGLGGLRLGLRGAAGAGGVADGFKDFGGVYSGRA